MAQPADPTRIPAGPDEVIARFSAPPVAEVVAAVGFTELPVINFLTVGELWREAYVHDFPSVEVKPPYNAPKETFGPAAPIPTLNIELGAQLPLPRLWFTTGAGQELLQIQSNWFAANWRKVQPNDKYGRWIERRTAFERNWLRLVTWMRDRDVRLEPTFCEVTYINHIEPIAGVWENHSDAWKLFSDSPKLGARLDLEGMTWQAHYRLAGGRMGRLHVSVQPALRNRDGVPLVVMELTARCEPTGVTDTDILTTLDVCRDSIVHAFVDLTASAAKSAWGLKK